MPICSPTRSTLLTEMYPIHTGEFTLKQTGFDKKMFPLKNKLTTVQKRRHFACMALQLSLLSGNVVAFTECSGRLRVNNVCGLFWPSPEKSNRSGRR